MSARTSIEEGQRFALTEVWPRSNGPWRLSHTKAMNFAFPNAYFDTLGLPRLAVR